MRVSSPRVAVLVSGVLLAVVMACSESLPAPIDPPPPIAVDARALNKTCIATAQPPGRIKLELAMEGFENPLDMVDRPDLGLRYIAEMRGRVRAIDTRTKAVTTVLDLIGKVSTAPGNYGLLSFAVHPTKPYAFVSVIRDKDATTLPDLPFRSEILRFTTNDGGKTYDPASEKLILRVDRPFELHTLGSLAFGRDGFLYISSGDGGSNYAPEVHAYNPNRLLGAILRIDVDNGDPYGVPSDNPYVSGGGRPEIFAGGFRNPWKFTIDRQTGDVWAGDVGEISYEEVDKVEKGKVYGWPVLEGPKCFKPKIGCDTTGLTPPTYAYAHSDGGSVTGGYVYRGKAMPDLFGKYIFGDITNGHIFVLEGEGAARKAVLLNSGGPNPTMASFGEDADGELYALDWATGKIYKLVKGESNPLPAFPTLLSQTGCVDATDAKKLAAGVVPYDVNVELWSDGALKQRSFAIPDGKTIHVLEDGDFDLPEGSVAMKSFTVAGKLVETRLLRRHPGGTWSGSSYEWNDAQTDAVLLEDTKDKVLANGQRWTIPSPSQCFTCHTKVSNISLGLEALQLNRDREWAPSRLANQVTRLSELGYLDRPLDPATAGRLAELTGPAPLEDRARSYLHSNCSVCHRPGGANTNSPIDLRFTQPKASMLLCLASAYQERTDVKIMTAGDPLRSGIFLRMTNRDDFQMPPLGTHVVDPVGSSVVESWIRSVTKCD